MTQCWKDVIRHFVKLRLCTFVTNLALSCHNVATTSLLNVVTTLPTDVSETFLFKELTTPMKPIIRRYDNVVTSLCLLGWLLVFGLNQICVVIKVRWVRQSPSMGQQNNWKTSSEEFKDSFTGANTKRLGLTQSKYHLS